MFLRPFAITAALAAVFPAAAIASPADALPEQPQSAYESSLPGWIAQAKELKSANVGGKIQTPNVMIAPVVFNWAPAPEQFHAFAPWWKAGERDTGVQRMVDDTHRKIVDAFRARNWGFYSPAWLREQGANIDKAGETPLNVGGRAYGGGPIAGYAYVSEKLRQWHQGTFGQLTLKHPGPRSVAMVNLNTVWTYNGHSRLNGEAMVNYNVFTTGEVKVCESTRCASIKIEPAEGLKAILPVPAEKAIDEGKHRAANTFAIAINSDYFSGVAVAMLETLLDTKVLAVAPGAPAAAVGAAVGDALTAPGTLNAGQRLLSKDGRFEMAMQADGNLVLYQTRDRRALWSSGTDGKGGARVTMQEDGNLVVYKADGAPVWASNTWQKGAVRAVMQDDGNFVLYKADGKPVWASGTCCY